ncbi:MAG: response regulator transcription factor [bacterium]
MLRRVYYIEDNERMGKLLQRSISRIGDVCPVEVSVFTNYRDFITAMRLHKPNIILIDLMLPNGENGYEILREIKSRAEYKHIPVLIVSAKITDYDRYACYEAGAHGYFTKPFFSLDELNAAIKNFMLVPRDGSIIVCGFVSLDTNTHTVVVDGVEVDIVNKEFELLAYLAKNPNVLLSKEKIYENVWKEKFPEGSRTIDQYIKAIRKKAFANRPDAIETHRGLGYRFVYDIEE